MADPTQTTGAGSGSSGSRIPDETARAFPELLALIRQSQSMNPDERQYWIDILPVMNAEQIANLRTILINERDQLAAIDKKYAGKIDAAAQRHSLRQAEEERRKQLAKRRQTEGHHEQEEARREEELLKKIEEL